MISHYIPAFTKTRGHGEHMEGRAVCGSWTGWRNHSIEPRCPDCAAWLEQDAVDTEALVKQWAAEDAARAVRS